MMRIFGFRGTLMIVLLTGFLASAQDYRLIRKAEKILDSENPDLKKAEKCLKRARNADYGFCGNAYLAAISEIQYLDARIQFLKADYPKCLEVLDSGETWDKQFESDSLKVLCLTKLYGKLKIRDLILSKADQIARREDTSLSQKFCLQLNEIDYRFCFYDQNQNPDIKKEITLLEVLEQTNFYPLLQN